MATSPKQTKPIRRKKPLRIHQTYQGNLNQHNSSNAPPNTHRRRSIKRHPKTTLQPLSRQHQQTSNRIHVCPKYVKATRKHPSPNHNLTTSEITRHRPRPSASGSHQANKRHKHIDQRSSSAQHARQTQMSSQAWEQHINDATTTHQTHYRSLCNNT